MEKTDPENLAHFSVPSFRQHGLLSSTFFQLMRYGLAKVKKINDIQADLEIGLKMT